MYRQHTGIAQGSVLSSLLCSYYYGDMENNTDYPLFKFLDDSDGIMMRYIDDFLLITKSKQKAMEFVQTLHKGIAEYNCVANSSKTHLNFDATVASISQERRITIYKSEDSMMDFCGHNIDTKALEILPNFSRYAGNYLRETQTRRVSNPGNHLPNDLKRFIRSQLHPMYVDTSINSTQTAQRAVFQLAALSAAKFHCYAKTRASQNQRFLANVVLDVASYLRELINHMTHDAQLQQLGLHCSLLARHIDWLALRAFQHVLHRKHAIYHPHCLRIVDAAMRRLENDKFYKTSCHEELKLLNNIVEISLRADLQHMLY